MSDHISDSSGDESEESGLDEDGVMQILQQMYGGGGGTTGGGRGAGGEKTVTLGQPGTDTNAIMSVRQTCAPPYSPPPLTHPTPHKNRQQK